MGKDPKISGPHLVYKVQFDLIAQARHALEVLPQGHHPIAALVAVQPTLAGDDRIETIAPQHQGRAKFQARAVRCTPPHPTDLLSFSQKLAHGKTL